MFLEFYAVKIWSETSDQICVTSDQILFRLQDAIDFIKSKEKPLSLYIFTNDKKVRENIIEVSNPPPPSIGTGHTTLTLDVHTVGIRLTAIRLPETSS